MNDLGHALHAQVDLQIRIGRFLVRVIDPGEAFDLSGSSPGVDTPSVRLFTVLQRGGDVDEEESPSGRSSGGFNDLSSGLSGSGVGRGGGGDDGRSGSTQLGLF